MTDKQMGELWREHGGGDPLRHHNCIICRLIRKLVEERVKHYGIIGAPEGEAPLEAALFDFNIDPGTW